MSCQEPCNCNCQQSVFDGVVITGSVISNSRVMASEVSGSTITNSKITSLESIDAASVEKIVQTITQLPPEQLQLLAKTLFAALPVVAANEPSTTEEDTVPTVIYGERDSLLGAPSAWTSFGTHVIPLYDPA